MNFEKLWRLQPAPRESGPANFAQIPCPVDNFANQRSNNPTSPLIQICKGKIIEPTQPIIQPNDIKEINSKLDLLEQTWEKSAFHKQEILNLPLSVTRIPTISTFSSVKLFLDPNLTSSSPQINGPTNVHSRAEYETLANNLCFSLLPAINRGRIQSQNAFPPEELIKNPSDSKLYSIYISENHARESLNNTRMSHLHSLRPQQSKIKELCDRISKESKTNSLEQLSDVFINLWEAIYSLTNTLKEEVTWSLTFAESSYYIKTPTLIHFVLDAEIERARIYADLEQFRQNLIAWANAGQFRSRQYQLWQSIKKSWEVSPEVHSKTSYSSDHSLTGDDDADITIINTKVQTGSFQPTSSPLQNASTPYPITLTPVANPPLPKPPDMTSLNGAHRLYDKDTVQATQQRHIRADSIDCSLADMRQEVQKMWAHQSAMNEENQKIRIENDQLSQGLKQITKQFNSLQAKLTDNHSRMENMSREHEAKMIQAHKAYKDSLEQLHVESTYVRAQHQKYNPENHSTSFMDQQPPPRMDTKHLPVAPGAATRAASPGMANMFTGFPPPTRYGGTVSTEKEKQQAHDLRLMLESTTSRPLTELTHNQTISQPPELSISDARHPGNYNSFQIPLPTLRTQTNANPHPQVQIPNPNTPTQQFNNPNGEGDLTTIFRMMRSQKQPKMNLQPFDGEYKDFEDWYLEFYAKVHTNVLLSEYDKLLLLEKETTGRAKTLVLTCGRREDSYEFAIQKLKETYQGHDSKLQTLHSRIKNSSPLSHENHEEYCKFADDVQIFVNHLISSHNEKLARNGPKYCDEILYRLPQEEIIKMEEHKKKCLQSQPNTHMGYAQFLGVLVTHTQEIAADHRRRLKITMSLGISKDHSSGQDGKQSLLSSDRSRNNKNNSKPECDQSGQSKSGQQNYRTTRDTSSSGSSSCSLTSSSWSDSGDRSDESARAALIGAKSPKPNKRRSTSRTTGRSTNSNSYRKRSRTRTPDPNKREKHPRGLSPEYKTQAQYKNGRDRSATRRRIYNPGVQVTRLTPEEIQAQRSIISPARPSPEPPPKAITR